MHCFHLQFFFLFLSLFPSCFCFEPITAVTTFGGVMFAAGFAAYKYANCRYFECCDDTWVNFNYDVLKDSLQTQLYGQHLVLSIVPKALKGFLENKNPKKALVLSFHGRTGNGKNFVTQMIAKSLYKNSTSQFVHLYTANKHFPHEKEVAKYKDQIRREIMEYTKLCDRSMFIFDEVHSMPRGILDAIKPFMDYHEALDGVDYRKNIFIFLSNAGGDAIFEVTLKAWLDGKNREQIEMKDIEPLVSDGALHERGGLQHSQIIENELIDIYVPFLPLEKEHVKKCIETELENQNKTISTDIVNKISNELTYIPKGLEIFSKAGCKRLDMKVQVYS